MLNPAHAQKSFRNLNAFVSVPHVLESRNSIVNGPLRGLTIAIKDNICTADFPTTCGSQGLLDFTSPYDATVVAKIRCAGGLVAGKTNLDEFGMGSHSTHTAYGHVRNQIQPLSAGGSSGGSAVAVATGQCHAALGTDTGGSVRLPAAYTGIYGFKPSYGLLSRWGVVAYANSLDTVGILSSDLLTIRTIFSTLNAHDPLDPTSLLPSTRLRLSSVLRSQRHELEQPLRIGVPAEYNITSLSPAVRYAWSRALHHIRGLGHTIHPVTLPSTRLALSAYYILAPAEASSNLAKYDGVRYGLSSESSQPESQQPGLFAKTRAEMFHPEIQRRILLGTYTLSAGAIDNYFLQAQRIRRLVQGDYDRVFALSNPLTHPSSTENTSGMVDALITPTAPTLPPSLAALESADPIAAYATDVFTVPVSLAGLPAINLPVEIPRAMAEAEGSDGVEWAGIQIVGQFGDDEGVLRLAEQLSERAQKHEQNSRD